MYKSIRGRPYPIKGVNQLELLRGRDNRGKPNIPDMSDYLNPNECNKDTHPIYQKMRSKGRGDRRQRETKSFN